MLRLALRFLAFLAVTIGLALAAATLTHHATLAQAPAQSTQGQTDEASLPRSISADGYGILVHRPGTDR